MMAGRLLVAKRVSSPAQSCRRRGQAHGSLVALGRARATAPGSRSSARDRAPAPAPSSQNRPPQPCWPSSSLPRRRHRSRTRLRPAAVGRMNPGWAADSAQNPVRRRQQLPSSLWVGGRSMRRILNLLLVRRRGQPTRKKSDRQADGLSDTAAAAAAHRRASHLEAGRRALRFARSGCTRQVSVGPAGTHCDHVCTEPTPAPAPDHIPLQAASEVPAAPVLIG